MHSTTVSSSSTSTPTTTTNIEQYHYPPISTLRRPSRPSNINLSVLDHNNSQHSNDPGIYSAPICYVKQTNNSQQNIQQTSHPYTATFQYQPQQQQQQHLQLPSHHQQHHHHHHSHQLQHNISLYPQQQQQQIHDPYSQHQHTPHTFPLQTSPNHYHQYFYFPPSTLQTNNSHSTTNSPQTTTHNNRLHAVQMEEQQQWSNPVLSPLMLKRMNENVSSMPIVDDDEDPSASIDALVADVDSSSHDLLDDQQNKSLNELKPSLTTSTGAISPSPHVYLRGTSHILTTPPNPLASDDHPDNQLTGVGNNFQKTFSPIPSAGFELTNNNVKISSTESTFFTFDTNMENQHNKTNDDNKHIDIRTTKISSNNFIQDDNSNQSSTNSSSHNPTSRNFGQILQTSEQQSSSSPLSNDIKSSLLDSDNNSSTTRHICLHPDCNKTFANKSALAKHKLTHSQDRKHKCPKCSKGFKRLDHLHGHMLTHEEEKPHKCRVPNCTRTYCDARSLKRHIENTHQDILAAIHQGQHEEYRKFLPETAFVKTKDLSMNNEFSIDSIDSNSPRSMIDTDSSFSIRTSTGNKLMTTYTFDEEKCVECHICKKSFKNGAALNGHMRLHGGFNDKQSSPSPSDPTQKKKRTPTTKRKRIESPSTIISIKKEEQDISNLYPSQSTFSDYYDQTSLSRSRSVSSSTVSNNNATFSQYKSPMSVQPPTKQTRKQIPLSHHYEQGMMQFDMTGNQQLYQPPVQHSNEKTRNRPMNGIPSNYPYNQSPNLPQFQVNSSAIPATLFHQLLRQKGEFYLQTHQSPASFEDPTRYTPPLRYPQSPMPPSTSVINTPVTSPYSNPIHHSPQMCNTTTITTTITPPNNNNINSNGMQPSPATQSTSSSCSSTSSSFHAPKKRFLNAMKHETQDDKPQPVVEDDPPSPPAVLKIVPDLDSPVKKGVSGFLIGTPSSTGTNSSSSTSSNTHFNYDVVVPNKKPEPTPSSFLWPSQFRRQLSLNVPYQTSNPIPSTPYTPPPMLSPFRKGPGLYYRVFSQPGTSTETPSMPTTPILPFTPAGEESAGPKINIGREYQAIIPKLRTDADDHYSEVTDELLFSPSELPYLDEKSLEKFEQLHRINPYLFSPRHSPTSYPLELIYMLLYEYNGDLQRTLAALLEGTAKDIKQCRPIHHYRFPECDNWTQEEIDAFTKAIQTSEKNFDLVSRTVGTKTVKQCIEFHYMPKVNLTGQKIFRAGTSSVLTRRKRFQLIKSKQHQQQQLDDETSSSSISEFSPMNSNNSPAAQFSCDIDECSRTFTTERACRAHRKEHRRNNTNGTTIKRITK